MLRQECLTGQPKRSNPLYWNHLKYISLRGFIRKSSGIIIHFSYFVLTNEKIQAIQYMYQYMYLWALRGFLKTTRILHNYGVQKYRGLYGEIKGKTYWLIRLDIKFISKRLFIMIEIITGFDGSSPADKSSIETPPSHNKFIIYPNKRKLNAGRNWLEPFSSRLSVKIANHGKRFVKTIITVDWQVEDHMQHKDFGYVKEDNREEWMMIPGKRKNNKTEYLLQLSPGITHLGLYSDYSYGQYLNFIKTLESKGAKVSLSGKSRQKRNIYLVEFCRRQKDLPSFLMQMRDHPYETAGSYMAEGIVEFLFSDSALSNYIKNKFNIYMLPMTNVDGVYNGLTRHTAEKGADLNRVKTVPDPAHNTIRKVIDKTKPLAYMNIHNYQDKFSDGLYVNDERIADIFQKHMPADLEHYKRWDVQTSFDFLRANDFTECPEEHKSWKNYVREKYKGIGANLEFPWFMLNTSDMREKGKKAFIAMALSVIQDKNL